MRDPYVPVTLTIAGSLGGLGIAEGDLDLIGSGVILAVLAIVVARMPESGRLARGQGFRFPLPILFTRTVRGRDA